MERIGLTSVSPGHLKISEIKKELCGFSKIIDEKYSQIDFELFFNFVIGYRKIAEKTTPDTQYEEGDIRYYEKEKWLGMDIVMLYDEFEPYKRNVSIQRQIMGNFFFISFLYVSKNTETDYLYSNSSERILWKICSCFLLKTYGYRTKMGNINYR